MSKEKKEKPKILMLSDNPLTNTGYSSQSLFLLNELDKKGWDCHLMAHNYIGQKLPKGTVKLADGTPFNFTLYSNGNKPYCEDLIMPRIRELKPDIFLILLDTFMLWPWIMNIDFAPARSVFWFPTDGGRFPVGCENILHKVSFPIAMSRFGQKQVLDYHNIKSGYIPHAIYQNVFKPFNVKEKEVIKLKWGLQNRFVIGMMGRNQGRKMHDRAFKMFARFCKDKPEAVLLCHFDQFDAAGGFDFNVLIKEYGLANRVIFTGTKYYEGFTYNEMNDVYNLMDVYLSTSSGEGFGIGTVEAMSCEVPVLNTAYTTTEEILIENNAGFGIRLVGTEQKKLFDVNSKEYDLMVDNGTITGGWTVERGLACIEDGVDKLNKLYNDKKKRESLGRNGRQAVLKKYCWDVVAGQWNDLLRDIICYGDSEQKGNGDIIGKKSL